MNILFENIEKVIKIQEPKVLALKRLNINSLIDLLLYIPAEAKRKNIFPDLSKIKHGEEVIISAKVQEVLYPNKKSSPIRVSVKNHTGSITLVFFKLHDYQKRYFRIGNEILFQGKVEFFDFYPQIHHPELIFDKNLVAEYEPKYPLTYAITNSQIRTLVIKAIDYIKNINEWIPQNILEKYELPSFYDAVKTLHYLNNDPYKLALKRLKFDEAFSNQLSFKYIKTLSETNKGRVFKPAKELQEQILNNLGFELTTGQIETINEIESEQNSQNQMLRLVQGDVGCGKTLVALLTSVNIASCKSQSAIMAPTEVLAQQHYEFFQKSLEHLGFKTVFLSSKITGKTRAETLRQIESGEADFIIGTHSLLQEKVKFKDLAYIVVDEQHKFGVNQRMELISKGIYPDVLIMSATPIPRSLSLTLFGDLEISKIMTMPKNRKQIKTFVSSISRIDEVIELIKKHISRNEKIYWVCPLIENNPDTNENDYIDVATRFEYLRNHFAENVIFLHGGLSAEEKIDIIEKYRSGQVKILVSTTVIEVGVDVKDATLIIIENAEKFGLAQLHQLRGRVGRSDLESSCILLYGKRTSKIASMRLKIMKESTDGFFIAEQDLKLRGEGDIFGSKQSGEQSFRFLDLAEDSNIITLSNKLAKEVEINNENMVLIKIFNPLINNKEIVA